MTSRRFRKLIEEAVVDCYTADEQHQGFLVMFEDHVACPFRALVVGEEVEVRGFDWDGTPQGIMAICRRKGRTYRVNATALEWAARPPVGAEWFDAYRAWLNGKW
ncbi:MAG: calcium-binding protein [Candidatus Methylomirabilia bacterium]